MNVCKMSDAEDAPVSAVSTAAVVAASVSSSSSTAPATVSAPSSMTLFYPMEREDSANPLNIIEESDDHDLNAEAFADMAMSALEAPKETNGTVHYSRREDKMQVLQEHPVVASVSTDGRSVGCKCGKTSVDGILRREFGKEENGKMVIVPPDEKSPDEIPGQFLVHVADKQKPKKRAKPASATKIARELFPHLFPDDSEYDHSDEGNGELEHSSSQSGTKKRQPKLKQQLLEAEKLLLHDVIEGEALWFVDKDGSSIANRPGPPRNPINRKFCSGRVCSLLESEFDMKEPYARVLRDLALAEIPGTLNTWMEMATIGLSGDFDSHPALLGLAEAMVRLKDKEQRGVGLQNMTYSDHLDAFMRSLTELSPEACEGVEADEARDAEDQMEPDPGAVAFLSEFTSPESKGAGIDDAVMPTDHVPCTGLRDENVQAYVSNAVQLVGGSRPRYVIARELFPRVFGNDKKVRIVDKLDEEQRLVLQDAVFSECLWRVDKEGRCVRSLRCKRFVPATDHTDRSGSQNQGVCRACRDLRTVPNFRSVLSRSKVPKKLENIKYVPSVYTESDPFLRKLSKNSAFRGLYQTVKHMVSPGSNSEVSGDRLKQVYFWLRFARMGVFGHFKTHPVFEGLMKSMVEIKDKERRGVGKQNMQYSRALDDFMQELAQISTEAFELFAGQFCGRTLRSQKVKRRSASATPVFTRQTAIGAPVEDPAATQHQHYLMPPDDLLGGRSLSTEESQRFMDRMLDEVRLSVSREMQLAEEEGRHGLENSAEPQTNDDDGRLGPETYLNDDGVLTTEI
eukprot:jgi/Phyca11/532898/estExt2_fgenesh1_pg.C_PHYCAscaffold_90049